MEIDRGRFLFLVGAIAGSTTTAAACSSANGPNANAKTVVVPAQPATTEIAIPPMAPSTSAPLASASTTPAAASAAAPAAPPSKGLWGFSPLAPPRSCATLKCPVGAPYDEMRPVVARECRSLEVGLRPEVFQRAMACLTQNGPGGGVCDTPLFGDEPGQCLEHWSEPPQLEPATAAKCKPILAACSGPGRSVHAGSGTLTMEQCQGILTVTKPSIQARMIHCITEYCDGAPGLCWMALDRY